MFEGVHALLNKNAGQSVEIVWNLKPDHLYILTMLGIPFEKIYARTKGCGMWFLKSLNHLRELKMFDKTESKKAKR